MDPNFLFYVLAGVIVSVGLIYSTRNEKNDVLNDFFKNKGWRIISIEKDKTNFGWRLNVRSKSERFYYIKYYDKAGKLHDCALHVDYGENEFNIIKDKILENP